MPWTIAEKEYSKSYRRVFAAAKRFMVRRHKEEAKKSRQPHAPVMGGVQGKLWRARAGGRGEVEEKPR